MVATLRIATWNVERPRDGWKIRPAQHRRMDQVDADVWILTETRTSFSPGPGYHGLHTPPHPQRDVLTGDERYVGIWSRWPLTPVEEIFPDGRGAITARCETPLGPLLIQGVVLPWANDRGSDGTATMWQEHARAIERRAADWQELRRHHPRVPLVVAGDLNQSRDGSSWYGTRAVRDALTAALEAGELRELTAQDVVTTGHLQCHHLVDHVCVSRWLEVDAELRCWEQVDDRGIRLSDHPTVAVDLTARPWTEPQVRP